MGRQLVHTPAALRALHVTLPSLLALIMGTRAGDGRASRSAGLGSNSSFPVQELGLCHYHSEHKFSLLSENCLVSGHYVSRVDSDEYLWHTNS